MSRKAFGIFMATLSAPIIPGIIFAVGTPIGADWTELILPKLGLFIVGYLITLILVLLFGLPLFLFAHRNGWVRWWTALLGGCFIGFIFSLLLRAPYMPHPNHILVGLKYGIAASMTFWVVFKFTQSRALSD